MPLRKGKRAIGRNLRTLRAEGRPPRQALAIALRTAGVERAPGRRVVVFDLYTPEGQPVGTVSTSLGYTQKDIEVGESHARGYPVVARRRRSSNR